MAAIGTTAGMVGHDIRNPLQAMIGDVYLLKEALGAMPECEVKKQVKESLDGLEENILYVNKIVSDLQDFARPIQPQFSRVNLCQLVADTVEPFSFPKNIQHAVFVDSPLEMVTDQSLLRRVFENLIINAVQAMPNGGKLQVTGGLRQQKVCIIVQDTGVGIPREIKPKLFIPMFTTKSKGQGFGLTVVKRIVEALNGTVDCESQEGKGTRFIIEFPVEVTA
ncbi:MAG: HAMP domain-containing histidine kinase [Candidatus Bathyarchaeota archaeon]|nr:HAMP domain-containing histidine kinase [Candidatus Bathyarchaeota archaeon]